MSAEVFQRHEIKYLTNPKQRAYLEEVLKDRMVPDPHGESTICNVYYDTPNYRLIRRSLEKPAYKEKIRVRSYGTAAPDDMVFLELKKKYDGIVYKRRIELKESDIPVSPAVSTACEMLGLDPLYCACEGRLIAITAPECAEKALEILKNQPNGTGARIIGRVTGGKPEDHPGKLVIRTPLGTGRIAQKLSGAQLPRIC